METFSFCPNSLVPELLPREPTSVVSMNGWTFAAKPTTPYVKTYKLTLHGLRWFLLTNGIFDEVTSPTINARLLEKFYEVHENWKPFYWTHPHTGVQKEYRFAGQVIVPKGLVNSNGAIEPVEVKLIENNPGYV